MYNKHSKPTHDTKVYMAIWYRLGDFFQLINITFPAAQYPEPGRMLTLIRKVKFRSIDSPIAKEIEVELYVNGEMKINITGTLVYGKQLQAIADQIIPNEALDSWVLNMGTTREMLDCPDMDYHRWFPPENKVWIKIASGKNESLTPDEIASKILELFKHVNQQCEHTVFSNELTQEILALTNFVYYKERLHDNQHRHVISDKLSMHSHTHPDRKNSKELIRILSTFSKLSVNDENEVRCLLAQGESPDQVESGGMPAVSLAILRHKSTALTSALMFYGARIFDRSPDSVFLESPFELALQQYTQRQTPAYLDILNIMGATLTTLERQITKSKSGTKVVNSKITSDANSIITTFSMSDGKTLDTILKHNSQLTRDNKQAILNSIEDVFDKSNVESFLSDNYLVESIHDDLKVVGFNIFEILTPDNAKDTDIVLHVVYSFIQAPYRGYGIMALLEFRLAYAMQVLSNQHDVAVFYTAIDPSGYKQAKDHLAMPRHQPPDMDDKMHKILSRVYHGSYQYHHNGSMCYVLDDASAKAGGFTGSKTDFTHQYVFENMLGSKTKDKNGKTRGVPVLFYIGDENYIKQSQMAEQIGVNFTDHILKLSSAIRRILQPYMGSTFHQGAPNLGRVYKRADLLFWKCPRTLTETGSTASPSLSAKL